MMKKETRIIKAKWLQLSDLHVFPEADTTLILKDYEKLAKIISPDFILVTGDFRHKKSNTPYNFSKEYLEKIIQLFKIDKEDVFFVPGNHDTNDYTGRSGAIATITGEVDKKYDCYSQYMQTDPALTEAFSDYTKFVQSFYDGTTVDDERLADPCGVYCLKWRDKLNLLHINTALISDGERGHSEIVDINKIVMTADKMLDKKLPTIMLGHHGLESIYPKHKERLEGVLRKYKISAYLHGDIHVYANDPIRHSIPNTNLPEIACGKSAPQAGDDYSDVGVLYYSWEDDTVFVYAYQWTMNGFIKDNRSIFIHDVDKPYYFPMLCDISADNPPMETGVYVSFGSGQMREYLRKVEEANYIIKRRDSIDYDSNELKDVYTYPAFTNKKGTPIIRTDRPFRVIITSASGYGKSLLLQCIALLNAVAYLADSEKSVDEKYKTLYDSFCFDMRRPFFPIIIRAKDFNDLKETEIERDDEADALSILRFASYGVPAGMHDNIDPRLLSEICLDDRALLLIDSFDELQESKAIAFLEMIKAFVRYFPKSSVILTSRPTNGLRNLNDKGFITIGLEAFNDNQILEQVTKRVPNALDAEKIKKRLFENEYLHLMARNPLMLGEIIYAMMKSVAVSVIDLLEIITNAIIQQRWDEFEKIDKNLVKHLFACIAWRAVKETDLSIPWDNIRGTFSDAFAMLRKIGYRFQIFDDGEGNDHSFENIVEELANSISCRSGILILTNNNLKYVFQDNSVKWYLASFYLKVAIEKTAYNRSESEYIIIQSIAEQVGTTPITDGLIHALIMSFSILERHQQSALLKYIFLRGTTSVNPKEIAVISKGLINLLSNTFGHNRILNERNFGVSEEQKMVGKWIINNYKSDQSIKEMIKRISADLVEQLERDTLI